MKRSVVKKKKNLIEQPDVVQFDVSQVEITKACARPPAAQITFKHDPKQGFYNNLFIYPSATGCGLGQLNGNTYIPLKENNIAEVKKRILEEKVRCRYGAIIATIGDTHYKAVDNKYTIVLEKLGFKKILDYPNINHGTDYKQHLYILI